MASDPTSRRLGVFFCLLMAACGGDANQAALDTPSDADLPELDADATADLFPELDLAPVLDIPSDADTPASSALMTRRTRV
jgi:hypothetical protein